MAGQRYYKKYVQEKKHTSSTDCYVATFKVQVDQRVCFSNSMFLMQSIKFGPDTH